MVVMLQGQLLARILIHFRVVQTISFSNRDQLIQILYRWNQPTFNHNNNNIQLHQINHIMEGLAQAIIIQELQLKWMKIQYQEHPTPHLIPIINPLSECSNSQIQKTRTAIRITQPLILHFIHKLHQLRPEVMYLDLMEQDSRFIRQRFRQALRTQQLIKIDLL